MEGFTPGPTDIVPGVPLEDILKSKLSRNGGTTKTLALVRGSPAIDASPLDGGCESTDQRGVFRPQGKACDIGAFEVGVEGNPFASATPTRFCTVNDVPFQLCRGSSGRDTIVGTTGNDVIVGRAGRDLLKGGRGDDHLFGQSGDDNLEGGRGNDQLKGGNGSDRLSGGTGSDELSGGGGNDILSGSSGRDALNGDSGADRINGGPGLDACSTDANDVRVSSCP